MIDSSRNELILPPEKKGIIKPPANLFQIDDVRKSAQQKKVSFKIAVAEEAK